MISDKEYLHSSVLWLRILEPYVPLRNATKRKRLRIGYICRNHNIVYMSGVNSNDELIRILTAPVCSLYSLNTLVRSALADTRFHRTEIHEVWLHYPAG